MRTLIAGVIASALALCAQVPETPGKEIRGIPPRPTPQEYQAQAKAGNVTIVADFFAHSVPTAEGTLSSEKFVVVEAGMFGPPDARAKVSAEDFSLRINGKKAPLPSQPYGLVVSSLRDPEWVPPDPGPESSAPAKGSLNTGGGARSPDTPEPVMPPAPIRIPPEMQRAMQLRVQKAALPEGDRTLPVDGLLFFQYSGSVESIHSVELIYNGPAGKATLALH